MPAWRSHHKAIQRIPNDPHRTSAQTDTVHIGGNLIEDQHTIKPSEYVDLVGDKNSFIQPNQGFTAVSPSCVSSQRDHTTHITTRTVEYLASTVSEGIQMIICCIANYHNIVRIR